MKSMSIQIFLSIPFAELRENGRERSALKHSLILDLIVALKDSGHTLRPALIRVTSIGPVAKGQDDGTGDNQPRVNVHGTLINVDLKCPGDSDASPKILLQALLEQAATKGSVLKAGAISQHITDISPFRHAI